MNEKEASVRRILNTYVDMVGLSRPERHGVVVCCHAGRTVTFKEQ